MNLFLNKPKLDVEFSVTTLYDKIFEIHQRVMAANVYGVWVHWYPDSKRLSCQLALWWTSPKNHWFQGSCLNRKISHIIHVPIKQQRFYNNSLRLLQFSFVPEWCMFQIPFLQKFFRNVLCTSCSKVFLSSLCHKPEMCEIRVFLWPQRMQWILGHEFGYDELLDRMMSSSLSLWQRHRCMSQVFKLHTKGAFRYRCLFPG